MDRARAAHAGAGHRQRCLPGHRQPDPCPGGPSASQRPRLRREAVCDPTGHHDRWARGPGGGCGRRMAMDVRHHGFRWPGGGGCGLAATGAARGPRRPSRPTWTGPVAGPADHDGRDHPGQCGCELPGRLHRFLGVPRRPDPQRGRSPDGHRQRAEHRCARGRRPPRRPSPWTQPARRRHPDAGRGAGAGGPLRSPHHSRWSRPGWSRSCWAGPGRVCCCTPWCGSDGTPLAPLRDMSRPARSSAELPARQYSERSSGSPATRWPGNWLR